MTYRSLIAADAATFRELRLFALQESPASFGSSYEEAIVTPPADFTRRLQRPASDGVVVGAFQEATLIAIAGLTRLEGLKEKHKAEISGMYVHPSQRRKGIARGLMKTLMNHAHSWDGVLLLRLTVSANNPAAKALYEEFGFRKFGTERKALYVAGHFVDEDYMAMELETQP